MRIGTIRRSAWSAHGGALSATTPSTGIAVFPSHRPCHFQAPVHFPRTVSSSTHETSTVRRVGGGTGAGAVSYASQLQSANRGHLGAGLVENMPSVPEPDPQGAVLHGPPGRRAQAILRWVQSSRRQGPRPAGRPGTVGFLSPLRGVLFLHPEALAG